MYICSSQLSSSPRTDQVCARVGPARTERELVSLLFVSNKPFQVMFPTDYADSLFSPLVYISARSVVVKFLEEFRQVTFNSNYFYQPAYRCLIHRSLPIWQIRSLDGLDHLQFREFLLGVFESRYGEFFTSMPDFCSSVRNHFLSCETEFILHLHTVKILIFSNFSIFICHQCFYENYSPLFAVYIAIFSGMNWER